jgi:hypothetical protein
MVLKERTAADFAWSQLVHKFALTILKNSFTLPA